MRMVRQLFLDQEFRSRLIEPALTAVVEAQATQTTLSPTSDVEGLVFGRFVQIWLENLVGHVSFPHSE
jgi:hypothetical protein